MVNVLRAIILAGVLGVRVVLLTGVGVVLGVLVAPVLLHVALGHLPTPSSLAHVSTGGDWTGRQQDASIRAALGWTPEDTAQLNRTLDHPFAVFDRLDELGGVLSPPASP